MRTGVNVILQPFRQSDQTAAGHGRRLQLFPRIGISRPVSLRRKTPRQTIALVLSRDGLSRLVDFGVFHHCYRRVDSTLCSPGAHEQWRGSWLMLPFHILTNDMSAFLQKLAVFLLESIQDVTIDVDFSHNLPSHANGRDDFGFRFHRT